MTATRTRRVDHGAACVSSGSDPAHAGGPAWSATWRRRVLVLAALAGCVGVLALARWLAAAPTLDLPLQLDRRGALVLPEIVTLRHPNASAPLPEEQQPRSSRLRTPGSADARNVLALSAATGERLPVDGALLQRSPRWQIDGTERQAQVAQLEGLAFLLARPAAAVEGLHVELQDGSTLQATVAPRGAAGLGWWFWPLAALALLVQLSSLVVLLARPGAGSLLFVIVASCQAGNLLFIAIESLPGLGLPAGLVASDLPLRAAFDLFSAAAVVHGFAWHPRRLRAARAIALLAWCCAALLLAATLISAWSALPWSDVTWWLLQGGCIGFGAAALLTVEHSLRVNDDPHTRVLRRFAMAAVATLVLVSLAAAMADLRAPFDSPLTADGAAAAAAAWTLFLVSLLLLTPLLTRQQPLLSELALLAGVSTVAISVGLFIIAVAPLGSFASLAIAVFLALTLYAVARQWILERMLGTRMLSPERAFDHIYRAARMLQRHPTQYPTLLVQLLRDLYEPLEVTRIAQLASHSQVLRGGSALLVPQRQTSDGTPDAALVLRHAGRGQRLFTVEDARLADRVLEHLRRAVAHDRAVEQGRHEERLRIAQDLHDDIGARLLTLMMQAPTREIEDYIRHTLQDLKTLTRGLAVAEHRFSHAAAEWKADLAHRLKAADAELEWAFSIDHDPPLSMAQWSALTRVLRELVSNALFHGHATRVEVLLQLQRSELLLQVRDDGVGGDPSAWSHGLGIGGVRKRVRSLGGEVQWQADPAGGILCRVRVQPFNDAT